MEQVENKTEKVGFFKELRQNFWMSDKTFPIFTAILTSAMFTGAHMLFTYDVGFFNEVPLAVMMKQGLTDGGETFGLLVYFGASFLFARLLEGSLVGILDIGGSIHTGLSTGVVAILMGAGLTGLIYSFPLSLLTGAILGLILGFIIIGIKGATVGKANSTFGADIMMGAGNATGRFFGPVIILSACMASIPIGIFAVAGAAAFYAFKKPIAGGAIIGAMIGGLIFPPVI